MCFKFKKRINGLEKATNELVQILKSKELITLREESKKFKEERDNIKYVKFKVKNSQVCIDQDTNRVYARVSYEIPTIELDFDDNGNLIENQTFKAINELELIPFEDMKKLIKMLDNAKEEIIGK